MTMHIKKILSTSRRDFTAVYECESCKATQTGYGYDDANFHSNVIPAMVCEKCGLSSGVVTSAAVIPAGVVL